MYFQMLGPGNTEFAQAVRRGAGWKSGRLSDVLSAIETAQKVPSFQTARALLDALHTWRTKDPNEFNNRGRTDGVAYRLWMEAKQALRNRYNQAYPHADPPMPGGCPGVALGGVYVPEGR